MWLALLLFKGLCKKIKGQSSFSFLGLGANKLSLAQ